MKARHGTVILGLAFGLLAARALCAAPVLRWGGDEEGGAPYIYRAEDGSGRLRGFEVELVDTLAAAIGRRALFQQCQWDDLLKLLASGGVDVVVNGYELSRERLATSIATIPYLDRKSTRLNSSHSRASRMPSSA